MLETLQMRFSAYSVLCLSCCSRPFRLSRAAAVLAQVLAVAEGLRRSHGDRLVINDGGTEHPHRVSMTIPADLHGHVVGAWSSALAAAGIKVGEVVEAMPCGIIVT